MVLPTHFTSEIKFSLDIPCCVWQPWEMSNRTLFLTKTRATHWENPNQSHRAIVRRSSKSTGERLERTGTAVWAQGHVSHTIPLSLSVLGQATKDGAICINVCSLTGTKQGWRCHPTSGRKIHSLPHMWIPADNAYVCICKQA